MCKPFAVCVSCLLCTDEHRAQANSNRRSSAVLVERGHVACGYDFKAKVDDTIAENVQKYDGFLFCSTDVSGFLMQASQISLLPRHLNSHSLQMKTMIFRRQIDPNYQMLLSPTLRSICLVFMHV